MRKAFAWTIVILLFSRVAHSQVEDSDLDPITITTSLTNEKTSQTGRNLFVIKGEKFSELPVHSIDDLLRFLPGIEIQARGPMGAQSDIVIRGGTFQQVLVILDGLRLNDPNTGHFSSYIPIAPVEIDRIEILKGASSAVYGSEAVGGVVHIITKSFAAKNGSKKSNFITQLTGGEYDFFAVNAGGTYSNGKTTLSAGILSNNTSGQLQRGTRGSNYNHTASFSFGHHFNEKWELKMRYAIDSRKFSAQNFYTTFVSDTANEQIMGFWNQFGLVYNGKKDRISLNLGYKDLDDTYKFNSASPANQSNSRLLQALLTDEWRVQTKTTIVSGLQFISKRISSNDRGKHRVDQAAAFVVLNQQLGAKVFISPAIRAEWNETSDWELVPQLNLSYHSGKFQLRASGGKTIRDADFTERYNNYNKAFVASGRIGNPDLEAENSWSYEAGADYFLNNELKLSATFFKRHHSQLIDYVPTPYSQMPRTINLSPTGTYALAKNISKVNTTGVETELQFVKKMEHRQQIWAT
ncbi:MAG: TonB-dependent receptor plug domain-containing protein, partial [Flavisolibacter sp.]